MALSNPYGLKKKLETNHCQQTYSWPDVYNLRPHHSIHRILVPKPVLSATVHNSTIGALNYISACREEKSCSLQPLEVIRLGEQKGKGWTYTYPDQAYLARPIQGESVEADVLGTTLTS